MGKFDPNGLIPVTKTPSRIPISKPSNLLATLLGNGYGLMDKERIDGYWFGRDYMNLRKQGQDILD